MKKLLTILGAVGLMATTGATVVACGPKDPQVDKYQSMFNDTIEVKLGSFTGDIVSPLDANSDSNQNQWGENSLGALYASFWAVNNNDANYPFVNAKAQEVLNNGESIVRGNDDGANVKLNGEALVIEENQDWHTIVLKDTDTVEFNVNISEYVKGTEGKEFTTHNVNINVELFTVIPVDIENTETTIVEGMTVLAVKEDIQKVLAEKIEGITVEDYEISGLPEDDNATVENGKEITVTAKAESKVIKGELKIKIGEKLEISNIKFHDIILDETPMETVEYLIQNELNFHGVNIQKTVDYTIEGTTSESEIITVKATETGKLKGEFEIKITPQLVNKKLNKDSMTNVIKELSEEGLTFEVKQNSDVQGAMSQVIKQLVEKIVAKGYEQKTTKFDFNIFPNGEQLAEVSEWKTSDQEDKLEFKFTFVYGDDKEEHSIDGINFTIKIIEE